MILSGKDIKKNIIQDLNNSGVLTNKKMLVLSVGDNSSSISYLKGIENTAKELSVSVEHINFNNDIANEEYANKLVEYNSMEYSGILLLTPLPKHLDLKFLGNVLSPSKDLDCLNESNVGKFYLSSTDETIGPCTAKAVIEIIKINNVDLTGKSVCVVGASNIVGKPVSKLLLDKNATVTICNEFTSDLQSITNKADVVIACAGVAKLIKKDMINENCLVIDVGINFLDGKLCGDVDYDKCIEKSPNITPVPGGVGSITSAIIFKNMKYLIENS